MDLKCYPDPNSLNNSFRPIDWILEADKKEEFHEMLDFFLKRMDSFLFLKIKVILNRSKVVILMFEMLTPDHTRLYYDVLLSDKSVEKQVLSWIREYGLKVSPESGNIH